MHVDRERMSAKFWLDPDVTLAANYGFNRKELQDIERIMRENLELLGMVPYYVAKKGIICGQSYHFDRREK